MVGSDSEPPRFVKEVAIDLSGASYDESQSDQEVSCGMIDECFQIVEEPIHADDSARGCDRIPLQRMLRITRIRDN